MPAIIVWMFPDDSLTVTGYFYVANATLFLFLHIAYFYRIMKSKKDDDFPFASLKDFLPSVGNFVIDSER